MTRKLTESQKHFFPIVKKINDVLEVETFNGNHLEEFKQYNSDITYKSVDSYQEFLSKKYSFELIYSRELCHFEQWKDFIRKASLESKYLICELTLTFKDSIEDIKKCSYEAVDRKRLPMNLLNIQEFTSFIRESCPGRSLEIFCYNIKSSSICYPYPIQDILKGAFCLSKNHDERFSANLIINNEAQTTL